MHKDIDEGLGISITVSPYISFIFAYECLERVDFQGGREHGVPILISDIHKGQPADRCRALYVGDAILAVNGFDLRQAKHADAVDVLSKQVTLFSYSHAQQLACSDICVTACSKEHSET